MGKISKKNTLLAFGLIFLCIVLTITGCSSVKIYRDKDKIVAPYDGVRFDNLEPFPDKSFFKLLKWRFQAFSSSEAWPDWVESKVYKPVVQTTEDKVLVTVINHASVLVQMNGLNIITDPVYSKRVSPVSFAGPARVRKPGIEFDDLPKIDVVVVSHDHYDHLDLETLKRLAERDQPKILVGLGNRQLLESVDIPGGIEMDWWEEFKFGPVSITFVPAQHWSARGIFDKRKTLWGGFYIKGQKLIYFAGDTGWGKFFELLKAKMGSPDLALVPIGAYEPRWFMKAAHINPEESVKAVETLGAKLSIGVHFGTFKLTDEGIDKPVEELEKVLSASNYPKKRFIVPEFGQAYDIESEMESRQ